MAGRKTIKKLIGSARAAEILGRSMRWVQRLTQEGRIPAYEVGDIMAYDPVDVEVFAKTMKGPGRPPGPRPKKRAAPGGAQGAGDASGPGSFTGGQTS